MSNSLKYALGLSAVFLTGANSFAAFTLDDFDSFAAANYFTPGAGGAGGGFLLGLSGAGSVSDGTGIPSSEPITAGDTSFAGLVRRANLTSLAGGGTSDLYNGLLPSTALGTLNYNNGSQFSTATLVYTFPSTTIPSGVSFPGGANLTSMGVTQFDFSLIFPEAGLTLAISVASATGGEGPYTLPATSIPNGPSQNWSIPFASLSGPGGSVWDSVRSITFTLSNVGGNPNGDIQIDSIGFSNPNVPEAGVTIPSVAFAAGLGFFAWRRRQSK